MDPFSSASGSRRSSARWSRYSLLLVALLFLMAPVLAQNRKDLEKKRDALDKQIRTTSTLIEQARKEQRLTLGQVQLLEKQIAAREELIRTMNGEVRETEQQILENEELLRSLEDDLVRLKEEYGRMIQFAYRNRSAYDRLSYIFASESFAQAYRRSRYLDQIARTAVVRPP